MSNSPSISPALLKQVERLNASYAKGILAVGDKQYASAEALAEMLGITTRTLLRWENLRVGPPRIKVGNLRLYDLALLPDWLKRHERHPLELPGGRK